MRTASEIEMDIEQLKNRIVEDFLGRTWLGVMMTKKQKEDHIKLIHEYLEVVSVKEG